MSNKQKVIFSGIQPSGNLHLGNYLGAISQWMGLQDDYKCIFCIVDYHAITVPQDPKILKERVIEVAKTYIAAGIDPEKSIIFQQSNIREHTELAWILNCIAARMSDLNKMIQFKDKAGKNAENVSIGLYDYPVLQAADILLYHTNLVPVGEDQAQHVELTRELARRFNHQYGKIFTIPELKLQKQGARIMGLDNPENKMSKSASSEYNYIALNDDLDFARKKIMRAVTDADAEVKYDLENKKAISNLLIIYSLLSDKSIQELEKQYIGSGYGDFKKDLAELVVEFLKNFQEKYDKIKDDDVREILDNSAEQIRPIASDLMERVREVIGVV